MEEHNPYSQQRNEPTIRFDVTFFYHENTPPPVSIEEGSLRILVPPDRPLIEPQQEPQPGSPFVYTGDFRQPNGSNEIAHLRILHGNGDTIYKNSTAQGSWITLQLQKENGQPAGDLRIRGGNLFTTDSDARLVHSGGGNSKHTYRHQGGGATRFRVRSIRVTLGNPDLSQSPTLFQVDLGPVTENFTSAEYRVMMWLH